MGIRIKRYSVFVALIMVLQMIFPVLGAYAAGVAAPANLKYTMTSPSDIAMSWDAVSGATEYRLYEVIGGSNVLVGKTAYTNRNVLKMNAGDHTYVVTAVSAAVESEPSAPLTVTITYPQLATPVASYTITNVNDVVLKWNAVAYAQSYRVYQLVNGEKKYLNVTTGLNMLLSNLPQGQSTYYVSAVHTLYGESELSEPVTASITYPQMQAPTGLAYTVNRGNDVLLKWNAVPYTTAYNVYKIVDGTRMFVGSTIDTNYSLVNMPQGTSTFEVIAKSDRFGESPSSAVTVALTWPTMTAPANFTYSVVNGNDLTLKWNTSPYTTVYNLYQVVNGERKLIQSGTSTIAGVTNLPQGPFAFEVTAASDRFGESTSSAVTGTMIYPVMQAPANARYAIVNGNDVILHWDTAQYATGYNLYQILNGERKFILKTSNLNGAFTNLPEGSYQYEVTSLSSRFGESAAAQINAQVVFPVMQPPQNASATANGATVSLTWSGSSYANRYNVYEVTSAGTTLIGTSPTTVLDLKGQARGTHTYEIRSVSDRFGESSTGKQVSVFVDVPQMLAPSVRLQMSGPYTAALTWSTVEYAQKYNVYRLVDGSRQLLQTVTGLTATLPNLDKSQDYQFAVTAVNSSYGESVNSNVVKPAFDTVAPQTDLGINADIWYAIDKKITLTAFDDMTGVDKTYYSVDGAPYLEGLTFVVSGDGEHVVKYYSVDKAGNIETVKSSVVKIDKSAPTVTTNYAPDITQLKLSATDALSGVRGIYYKLNGTDDVHQGDTVDVTPTLHSITFFAADNAGNRSEETTLILTADTTAPVTTSDISDQWLTEDVTVHLAATDDMSGVAKTYYSVGVGGKKVEGTSFTVSTSGITPVYYYSVDVNGNEEALKQQFVKIDKNAPVTKTNLKDLWYNYDLKVVVNGQDDESGSAHTYYSLDGSDMTEGKTFDLTEDGVHKLSFYSVDNVGHVEAPQSMDVKMDKTAPTTEYQAVQNGADMLVSLNAADNLSGVKITYYSVDGAAFETGNSFLVKGTGNHSIQYYSEDNAGNYELTKKVNVVLDVAPPVTTSNVEDDWVNHDFNVSLTATDDISGVDKTEYALNDADYAEGSSLKVTDEGAHKLSFYSVDKAGNKEDAKSATVKLDKTAPVTTHNITGIYEQPQVQVELTATDNLSGVKETRYMINGEEAIGTNFTLDVPGRYDVSFYSVDNAGNREEPQTFQLVVDNTPPVTTSDISDDWSNADVAVHLAATDDLSGVDKTLYSVDGAPEAEGTTFTISAPGLHQVTFHSVDKAGNKETVKVAEVKIDKQAPVTASDAKDGWYTSDATVTLTPRDDLSGVVKTYYSVDGSEYAEGSAIAVSGPGVHKITFYSVDKAGNKEEVKSAEIKVDDRPPVTTSDVQDIWYKEDVKVNLTATDDLSGVDKTFYSIDGAVKQEGTSLLITEPGIHQVVFYSVDKAGNVEKAHGVEVKYDPNPPITTTDLKDGWYKGEAAITLAAHDDISGVDKTYYSVDGGAFVVGTGVSFSGSGIHKIEYYSVDVAGNQEQVKTAEVKIDGQPPVTVSDVTDGWHSAAVSVNLTATDDLSGVDKTFYSVDGSDYAEGTSFVVDQPGSHTVTFYSVDKAGNVEAVKTVLVKIDELPPVTQSDIKDAWSKTDVAVKLTATDDLSGVKTTYYSVDGAAQQEGTSFTVSGEGVHKVTYYSVDNAGNVESAHSQEVKIDKTAPVVTLDAPTGEQAMGGQVKLTYTATDNLSGIATQTMMVNGKEVANGSTITLDQYGDYTVTVTVTDRAGWTTTVTKKFFAYINATMEVTPTVITPNTGVLTVRLTMPQGYSYNFDLSTVKLSGASAITDKGAQSWVKQGMFKFNRDDIQWTSSSQTLIFRGYCDGKLVVAQKTVKVNLK